MWLVLYFVFLLFAIITYKVSIYLILITLIGITLISSLLIKPERGIYVFIFLSLVPVGLGKYLGHTVLLSYLLIPLIIIIYLIYRFLYKERIYSMDVSLNPMLIPVLLYFFVVFVNFLRNPPSLAKLGSEPQGFYAWFSYVLSFCYYFFFAEAIATNTKVTQKAIKFLLWLCFFLSVVGIILVYSPQTRNVLYVLTNRGFFYGFFSGGTGWLDTGFRLSMGGYRMGTLGGAASIGFLLLFVGIPKISNRVLRWLLYGLFITSIAFSGGRTEFAGIILAILIWLMVHRKSQHLIIFFALILALYLSMTIFYENLPGSFQRILQIRGRFEQLDPWRATLFPIYLKSFLIRPLFGVGIGSVESGFHITNVETFLLNQLRRGGHGVYVSLLYLWGLAGFIPFMWILVKSLKVSNFLLKTESENFNAKLATFCFFWLIYYLIPMGFGGRGSEVLYFTILGIISGLHIKHSNLRKAYFLPTNVSH